MMDILLLKQNIPHYCNRSAKKKCVLDVNLPYISLTAGIARFSAEAPHLTAEITKLSARVHHLTAGIARFTDRDR